MSDSLVFCFCFFLNNKPHILALMLGVLMWALFINVFGKAVYQFLGLILLFFFFLNQSYCGSGLFSSSFGPGGMGNGDLSPLV